MTKAPMWMILAGGLACACGSEPAEPAYEEASLPAAANVVAVAHGTVAVDGMAEPVWSRVPQASITRRISGQVADARDLSGTVRLMWDATYLYALYQLQDDADRRDSAENWNDDSVELYLDMSGDRGLAYRDDDLHYIVSRDAKRLTETAHGRTDGVRAAAADTQTGYAVELAVPWTTLQTRASAGSRFGLDVMLNDDDNGGKRDAQMSWNSPDTKAWRHPNRFGTAVLRGVDGGGPEEDDDAGPRVGGDDAGARDAGARDAGAGDAGAGDAGAADAEREADGRDAAGVDSAGAPPADRGSVSQLAARGLTLIWRDTLSASDLGKAPDAKLLFGPAGEVSRCAGSCAGDFRTIARAPDGRIALQYNIPRGTVPNEETRSRHFAAGKQEVGYAIDLWVPTDFEFPRSCSSASTATGASPGQGRWPIGLWIGGEPYSIAGGTSLANQTGISVRLNRDGGSDGQQGAFSSYVYNLNCSRPGCTSSNTCSVNCKDPGNRSAGCYGWGGTKSGALPRGRWVTVELHVRMNGSAGDDGHVAAWLDGKLIQEHSGFDFGRARGWSVRGIYTYNMWHCQGSPKAQRYWLSNLRLYAK